MKTNTTTPPTIPSKTQRLDPAHKIALALLAVLAIAPGIWLTRYQIADILCKFGAQIP